jgi:DNA polymerase III gamma/tau subunit
MENLYKKYEPYLLKDVIGHPVTVNEIRKRAKDDNFSHVTYFTGNSGIGKTVLQKLCAKLILCQNITQEGEPCNSCETCVSITEDKKSQYFENYNGSLLGKSEVEELVKSAFIVSPFSKIKRKVICIDEFQEIKSGAAEKSLLKILEIKNDSVFWIIGSMDNSKLNIATTSRCTPYYLKDLEETVITERLYQVCLSEKIDVESKEKIEILFTIAQYSQGSLRVALGYLERVIYANLWEENRLIEELQLIPQSKLSDITNKLLSGDTSVLQYKINEDIFKSIHEKVTLIYKYRNGLTLNKNDIQKLKGIPNNHTYQNIVNTMQELTEIYKYTYINGPVINNILFNVLEKNKKEENKKEEKLIPRRIKG